MDDDTLKRDSRGHRAWDGESSTICPTAVSRASGTSSRLQGASSPIPPEVTALTGITDDMVASQRIDETAVSAFVAEAVIVIAHNAGFDRKFAERYPVFERKAWDCSATEIGWRRHGFEGCTWAIS